MVEQQLEIDEKYSTNWKELINNNIEDLYTLRNNSLLISSSLSLHSKFGLFGCSPSHQIDQTNVSVK